MVDDGGTQVWEIGPTCHPSAGHPSCIDYFTRRAGSRQWVRHIAHVPSTFATRAAVRLGARWRDHDPAPVWQKAQARTLTDDKTMANVHPEWDTWMSEWNDAVGQGRHDCNTATFGDRHQCPDFRAHVEAFWARWVALATSELQELDGQTHRGTLAPSTLAQQAQGPPNVQCPPWVTPETTDLHDEAELALWCRRRSGELLHGTARMAPAGATGRQISWWSRDWTHAWLHVATRFSMDPTEGGPPLLQQWNQWLATYEDHLRHRRRDAVKQRWSRHVDDLSRSPTRETHRRLRDPEPADLVVPRGDDDLSVSYDPRDVLAEQFDFWAQWWGDRGATHAREQPSFAQWAALAIPVCTIGHTDPRAACLQLARHTSSTDGLHPRQVAICPRPPLRPSVALFGPSNGPDIRKRSSAFWFA
jgi:hypothetical protein